MEREPPAHSPRPWHRAEPPAPGKAEEPKHPRGVAVLAAPSLHGHFRGGKAQLLQRDHGWLTGCGCHTP